MDPTLHTPQTDTELRMGIDPLQELLAERDALIKQVSALRAMHGPGGTWDDSRSVLRSTIAMKIRAEAVASDTKRTEAYVEDASRSDPDYVAFIAAGTRDKAAWAELEASIEGIDFQIARGQAVARFLAAELRLSE